MEDKNDVVIKDKPESEPKVLKEGEPEQVTDGEVYRHILAPSVLAATANNLSYAYFSLREFNASAKQTNAMITKTIEENKGTSKELWMRLKSIRALQKSLEYNSAE